jgi:hypothetical protein
MVPVPVLVHLFKFDQFYNFPLSPSYVGTVVILPEVRLPSVLDSYRNLNINIVKLNRRTGSIIILVEVEPIRNATPAPEIMFNSSLEIHKLKINELG